MKPLKLEEISQSDSITFCCPYSDCEQYRKKPICFNKADYRSCKIFREWYSELIDNMQINRKKYVFSRK